MSDNGMKLDSQQPANGKHTARVILAILAAALIAFCVWAMSVYAQGGDPLAWATGSAAFQTTTEEGQPADQDAAVSQEASQALKLTTDDVYSALATLQFDGTDVSLEKDAAHVVLSSDGRRQAPLLRRTWRLPAPGAPLPLRVGPPSRAWASHVSRGSARMAPAPCAWP